MATSTNPFRTKVDLDATAQKIKVQILKKDDDSVVEEGEFSASDVHANLRSNVVLYGLSKLLQDRTSEVEVGPGKIAAMTGVAVGDDAGGLCDWMTIGAATAARGGSMTVSS